ncbi:MAG: hypothetical protein ABIH18_09885 [Candidatus Omnitrophota bacterium]
MNTIKLFLKRIIWKIRKLFGIDIIIVLLGKLLAERNKGINEFTSLKEFEFKAFSQWGEDGIIQYLIRQIEIPNKIFIEFGVEDYTEASTRFLLTNDNWSGLVMDSSKSNIDFIKSDDIYWRYDLKAVCSFITKDSINQLIRQNIKEKEAGLLVIDIDGNDYWIWKAIDAVNPRIVVCEYNGIFGCEHFITIPYEEKFNRNKKHYSDLYWGASLPALCLLAQEKGYVFVGCNSNGNNAFFIRKDVCPLPAVNYKKGFVMPKFRESRSRNHQLTYLGVTDSIKTIYDMEIFDLKLNKNILIKDIF